MEHIRAESIDAEECLVDGVDVNVARLFGNELHDTCRDVAIECVVARKDTDIVLANQVLDLIERHSSL